MNLIFINGFAEAWLEALVRACWQGGLALGLVWVVCRLFPRISPRAKSWLWRLAYLKLLTAFLLPASIDVPLLPAPVVLTSQRNPAEPATPRLVVPNRVVASPVRRESAPPLPLSLAGWLLFAWSIGVGAHVIRVLWGWRQMRVLRRSCRPTDDELLKRLCAETGHRLGLRQTPQIVVTPGVFQPLLLGSLRPTIVLPESLLANSTPDQMRMMLAHELAHYQRGDLWWGWLLVLGESFFFFHPLVWLSRTEWRLSQELACDALAVSAAKSSLADYGTMLLEVSTSCHSAFAAQRSITVSIVETKRNLERRLKAMQFIGQKPSRRIWAATACLMGAATLGVLPWGCATKPALRESNVRPVDLTSFYDDTFQLPSSWHAVPRGVNRFANIPFQVGGHLHLWGEGPAKLGRFYQERVNGIPASGRFQTLYLLHATTFAAAHETPIAEVVFRYVDGSSVTNAILYGTDSRDFWQPMAERDPLPINSLSKVVWRGDYPDLPDWVRSLRLFGTAMPNPKPESEVKAIDLISTKSPVSWIVLALTTGPQGMLKPDPTLQRDEPIPSEGVSVAVRARDMDSGDALPEARFSVTYLIGAQRPKDLGILDGDEKGAAVIVLPAGRIIKGLSITAASGNYTPVKMSWNVALGERIPTNYIFKLSKAGR